MEKFKISLGGDPEILVKRIDDGMPCPPTVILPEPKVVTASQDEKYGGFNRDGLAFELNPAPGTASEVTKAISHLMKEGQQKLAKFGLAFHNEIGMDISKLDPAEMPPDLYQMGCAPDYNAYENGKVNKVNVNAKTYPYRFAGGHITMELPSHWKSLIDVSHLVRHLDMTVGIYTLKFSDKWSAIRRQVYGKAGSFRFHPDTHILEYRTPDAGFILAGCAKEVYDLTEEVLTQWFKGSTYWKGPHLRQEAVLHYINMAKPPL